MTQATLAENYFDGGSNLTRGSEGGNDGLATIINQIVTDIAAAKTLLASAVGGSEGAKLVGTDIKANLNNAVTVEAALTSIDTANSATAAELASVVGGTEGALLVGTDAKANLGGGTTVEACLTSIDTANSATAAELASVVGGTEGALLVGTDAKANLGASATVEACLTFLDGQDPTKFASAAANPNAGAGTVGAIGDTYVATTSGVGFVNITGVATGWRACQDEDLGAAAVLLIEQTGQPVAGQTLQIGADTYTAIVPPGPGGAFDFVVDAGGANATMANLLAKLQANGTVNLMYDSPIATQIRCRSSDKPDSDPTAVVVAADPNLAIITNLANYNVSTGTPGNVNTEGGRPAGLSKHSRSRIAVTAGHVAQAEIRLSFPFAAVEIGMILVMTAAGALKMGIADTFVINNGDVLITLIGGGGNLAATDIVTVEVWS